jgi:hypothetical protein
MSLRNILVLVAIFAAALVAPGSGQVFWSNYSPSGVTDDIWCVTYANGTFAAVTSQGNLLTSTNGLNWSSQAIDTGVWLVSITYGNGTWVVVGDKGTILLSSDLKTWVHATSATTNKLNGVCYVPTDLDEGGYGNSAVWIAVGESGTIITSPDAQTWTLQPAIAGVTGFLHGMCGASVSPGLIGVPNENTVLVCGANGVVLGSGGEYLDTGPFGPVPQPIAQNLEAILSNQSEVVIVGWGGTILTGAIQLGGGLFGLSPSPSTLPNVIFRGLTYGNGYWIAAGEQGSIFRSTDGINWVQSYSGDSPSTLSTATLLSAAYSSQLQRFVVTGTGGTILVSNPPPTVFGNVSTRGYVSSTQTFIGGFVIQGTAPRTVLIRGDGPVLATFGVASPLADPVLTVYNSSGNVIATNTGWGSNTNPTTISTAALEVGAFALPSSSADSALLLTLQPGAYTAQITSAKNNSGTALFEAYTN